MELWEINNFINNQQLVKSAYKKTPAADSAYSKVLQETVKRFMPDGSIMLTTYEGSRIVGQIKRKPHMAVVPDYTAPPNPDGSVATELKPTHSLDWEMLMMM